MTKLAELIQQLQKISHLRSISNLLSWDQQVIMPPGGSESRSNQSQVLSGIIHDLATNKSLGDLISSASDENPSDPFDKQLIALAKKNFEKSKKIPKELVEEEAKLTSEAFGIWVKAKKENKFSDFSPILKKIVILKTKIAKHIDDKQKVLDVLTDEFDPDMKAFRYEELFGQIKPQLVELIQKIEKQKKAGYKIDQSYLTSTEGKFSLDIQEKLSKEISTEIGFSFENGRLDTAPHPFTTNMDKNDVRITTRFKTTEFFEGLAGTVHETGHALYEQGRNSKYYGTPVSDAHGMSLHESQSLLWERHVGLSKSFWERYWPVIQTRFPHLPKEISSEQVYLAVNQVEAGFIRVESDEVTYPMHIIIRFEIEKGLFDGSIQVDDLPKVWNQKMKDYLGIVPETDTFGVLQDIHWAYGAFGYFPSYLCGAMLSAQIFRCMEGKIENVHQKIKDGKFEELKKWLNVNIHEKGSLHTLDNLMIEVTGEKLNPKYFLEYLNKKYTEIYQLK